MKKIISSVIIFLLSVGLAFADVASKNPILQDEGTTVAGSGRILNFTGAGVAVTFAGGKYVITIGGGAGGNSWTAAGDSGTPFLVGDTAETVTLKGAGGNSVSAASNVWTVTWSSSGLTWAGNVIGNTKGGLGSDTSTWTGIANVNSGTWTVISMGSANQILAVNGAGTGYNWTADAVGGAGASTWTMTGDAGTDQLVEDTNTVKLAGGTGITTVVGATDTWTINSTLGVSISAAEMANEDHGDMGWTAGVGYVDDDSHAHTASTISGLGTDDISGLDISADTNLAVTAPIVLTDDTISIPKADTTTNGYLWSTDWNTFNDKMAGTLAKDLVTTAPLTGGTDNILPGADADITIAIPVATTSTNGYLWSTDWTTFNAKQAAIANYVGTVADGTGIDGTASGAGSTYTPTFDATELGNLIWGSGAGIVWTIDLATDVAITWTTAKTTFSGTVDATTLTEGTNAVYNSTEVPGGELGGTFASFTIDDSVAVTSWNLTTPTITTSLTTSTPTTLSAAELDRLDGLAGIIATDATACTDLEGVGLAIDTAVLKFAPAEVIAPTWGAGAQQVWTFDLATDYAMTWTTSLLTLSHGLTVSGTTTVGTLAGTIDAGGATSLEIPNGTADVALGAAGQIHLNTTDEQLSFHSAADGEISGEASISLLRHITATFDPSGYYDQETTYRVLPLFTVKDDAPEGITITEWKMNYVKGDPTTELDCDLMCDTTPDYNPAAGATVMDVLDTTTGASTADTGFDSATCANGANVYLRIGADPTDALVIVTFDLWFYNEED